MSSVNRPPAPLALALLVLAVPALTLLLAATPAAAVERAVTIPAPEVDNPKANGRMQTAVLAGGCFWGMQGVFEHVRGVREVLAGYSGGSRLTAQYPSVETGHTGHAESVQIVFDPAQLSYGELLQIFFSVAHDPTALDRQGPDRGNQYRSAIFFADDNQRHIAESYIAQLGNDKVYAQPIVTQVAPLRGFYRAEEYHQDYYLKNPDAGYIVVNDLPKIRELKARYPNYYLDSPVTVGAR